MAKMAEGDDKTTEAASLSLDQARNQGGNSALAVAVRREETGEVEGVDTAMVQWSRVTGGDQLKLSRSQHNSEGVSQRPPRVATRKVFPDWVRVDSPQTTDRKRSAMRWFLYWFPARGTPVAGEQAREL